MSTTAMWLLLAVVVILILFFSVLYKRRFTVHELALTGVMAALSLVAYLFFRIPFYGGSIFHHFPFICAVLCCISVRSAQNRLGQWVIRPFSLWRALISSVL